jgi:serine/threonine-protein kinase
MKVLLASLQRDQDFATRFLREIKVQARLVHPNIAQLYTAFEHQGNLMMILELVDGFSLLEMLRHGRIPLASAVGYASQALTALSYAHAQGVIHRDIKPGNIMVTRTGVVKLMDFGIAKAATDRSLTVTGNLIGSLYYMSPEQVRAEAIDSRSDLYSVGVVLYQMATGRKPFEGDSEYLIMRAQVEHVPPPPSAIDTAVPEELNQIILRALAKDPAERFQTGEEFREALQHVAVLLREDEIGVTRMLGGPRHLEGVPAQQPRDMPTASGARATGQPHALTSTAGSGKSAEAREDRRATAPTTASIPGQTPEKRAQPPARRRVPLWISAAIAAAVLVVAGTQLFDWMAAEKPAPTAGTSARIGLEVPQQPPAQPGPQAQSPTTAAGGPESETSSAAPPEDVARPAPQTPAAASRSQTASPPAPREAQKSAAELPNREPAGTSPEQAPRVTSPSAPAAAPSQAAPAVQRAASSGPGGRPEQRSKPASRPPSQTPTAAPPASSSVNNGAAGGDAAAPATKTANPLPGQTASSNPSPSQPGPPPVEQSAPVDRVYEPSEVDSPPRLLRQFQPRYSEAAQKAGVQGKVRLSAEIWPDGRAHNIRVVQSVGHPDLDRNAVAALSLWQFAPGRKDGVAVKVRALIDQTYRLQGSRSAPALSKDQ